MLAAIGGTTPARGDFTIITSSGSASFSANVFIDGGNSLNLTTGTGVNEISEDGTLASSSSDALVTEQAIKTYVDNSVREGGNGLTRSGSTITLGGTLQSNRTLTNGGFTLTWDGSGNDVIFEADGDLDAQGTVYNSSGTLTLGGTATNVSGALYGTSANLSGAATILGATTLNGNLTANGNVTLGSANTDDITITGAIQDNGNNAAFELDGATNDNNVTLIQVQDPTAAGGGITIPAFTNTSNTFAAFSGTNYQFGHNIDIVNGTANATDALSVTQNNASNYGLNVTSSNLTGAALGRFYSSNGGNTNEVLVVENAGTDRVLDIRNGSQQMEADDYMAVFYSDMEHIDAAMLEFRPIDSDGGTDLNGNAILVESAFGGAVGSSNTFTALNAEVGSIVQSSISSASADMSALGNYSVVNYTNAGNISNLPTNARNGQTLIIINNSGGGVDLNAATTNYEGAVITIDNNEAITLVYYGHWYPVSAN